MQAPAAEAATGSQSTGSAFTGLFASHGVAISMDGKGAWRDNMFRRAVAAQRQIRGSISASYQSVSEARKLIGRYLNFTTAEDRIRVLTATHRIKPTSTRCRSARLSLNLDKTDAATLIFFPHIGEII
jgi:putative transposase